ncbi:mediator of DNA damage checkpoint protein 1 isoform X2 [Archocentrus centrarchus]|uniref:mediator of DNA damage checkpoint protein 1 isoform X2 n=1 Tax=Archocentrus centrarchus TaxID=63155 RepID=UPI0011EA26F5|nr:uncharacterized protein KIAA1211-like homolog isoform X2 [Archocentrus centrarchus]
MSPGGNFAAREAFGEVIVDYYGIRLMEPFSGDTEETTEDIPGRKKFKLKSLKTRLFGRSKRAGGEGNAKLSQSASDITAGKGLGSEEDLVCSQGMMGSRALSHDSIFLADQVLTDPEPARVLSQENVHSKIKALQMKLQQQKMHLGPPPMVMPMRRPADLSSEDSLLHSPHNSGEEAQEALTKAISQPTSCALSPNPKLAPTKSLPSTPSHSFSLSVPSISPSSAAEAPSDFSTPAQFTPCLDTSAARHRMSIKPRNQRASTKKKLAVADSQSHLETLNNVDRREPVKEEKQHLGAREEETVQTKEEEIGVPVVHECLPSKWAEVAPATSEALLKSSGQSFSKQDHAVPVAFQVLRVKPHRRVDSTSGQRPHSSFIESGLKEQRQGDLEKQSIRHDRENTLYKPGTTEVFTDPPCPTLGSGMAFRSSSVKQQVQSDGKTTKGIKRSTQGSGSFHFSVTASKNQDAERPRSGSFLGVLERTEARNRTTSETEEKNTREKEELKELRERPFAYGRFRPEGAPPKTSAVPRDRKDSFKKVESETPSKDAPADAGAAEAEEMESSQEEVEEAVEAKEVQEEQGKTAFGIKLRSTSHSLKLRFDTASNRHSKSAVGEDQRDKQKCPEVSEKKQQTNASSSSGELRPTDQTPSGFSPPVKHSAPFTSETSGVQTTSANPREAEATPQEPQPAPQTASSEVSWMTLAMEKTRSLQQLFTSRFPRDFAGNLQANMQSAIRPQAQVQPTNQSETAAGTQTQTVQAGSQPSGDTVKAEKAQSGSQAQTVKTSPILLPQKASPVLSNASRDPQMSKHTSEDQTNTMKPVSHPVVTNPWTTQSPVRSPSQTDSSCQFAQGSSTQSLAQSYLTSGQQQSSWSNRGLHSAQQLKPTSSGPRGEGEASAQKEGPPLTARRAFWSGSVSEKAAFLERQAEWTTPPGPKGVDLRKANIDMQASGESPNLAKTTPVNKDTVAEEIQAVNLAELSPIKVPERPREDRWSRKNSPSSSSPSSSPTLPSVLQSMSDSGQPSWMELAKRKSMAWSDKTMD